MRRDPVQRLLEKVEIDPASGCWLVPPMGGCQGYSRIGVHGRILWAHRFAYEALVGPIPDQYQIDHVCHSEDLDCLGGDACPHRACVNPDHLEAVDQAENKRRGRNWNAQKTHCPKGHEYSPENTEIRTDRPSGGRKCIACRNGRARARYANDPEYRQRALDYQKAHAVGNAQRTRDYQRERYRNNPEVRRKQADARRARRARLRASAST